MVIRLDFSAWLTTTTKSTDVDCRFSINWQSESCIRNIRSYSHFIQLIENGIRLRDFFFGRLLVTLRSRYPSSFSFTRIVSSEGSSSVLYPFCSISCRRTSAAEIRAYNRLLEKVGSQLLWESTMISMSARRFGRWYSARFRPRAEKLSSQRMPLSSSWRPLRMVY